MKKHNFFILLLLCLLSSISHAEEINSFTDSYWVFDNVSKINVLGENDNETRDAIRIAHDQVTIKFTYDAIIIHNGFLSTSALCNAPYIIKAKTPSSYLLSEKTINLYNAVLATENNIFAENINIIDTGINDSCPAPYEELIENGDRLIVIDRDYLVFLKKTSEPITTPSNCKDLKEGQEFDGTSEDFCFYPNQSLKDTHALIVKENDFLKEELPQKQLSYTVNNDNIKISYKWINQHTLQLVIDMNGGNEVRTYLIEETAQGTKLLNTVETQY